MYDMRGSLLRDRYWEIILRCRSWEIIFWCHLSLMSASDSSLRWLTCEHDHDVISLIHLSDGWRVSMIMKDDYRVSAMRDISLMSSSHDWLMREFISDTNSLMSVMRDNFVISLLRCHLSDDWHVIMTWWADIIVSPLISQSCESYLSDTWS